MPLVQHPSRLTFYKIRRRYTRFSQFHFLFHNNNQHLMLLVQCPGQRIFYKKSADLDIAQGALNVGYCYEKGNGIEKNEYNAFEFYKKSADLGAAQGAFNVGY